MARTKTSTTKATSNVAVEEKTSTATIVNEVVEEKVDNKPLNDSSEIEVISLIPNVSYKDNHTGDFYEWDEVGHSEIMTFEVLKGMWRNSKGYFRNLCLKPNDDRVIEKFGLKNTYEKYEFLMDSTNYTRKNLEDICNKIVSISDKLKFTVYKKIQKSIVDNEISDIVVIRELEKYLKLDLISFIN